jgi:tetratricopeptide (TPR) repeat protein/tRNA A-37 threonylcarbamoyl transferase component Bud32
MSPPTARGDAGARLAAALADRYRIERELGQGGMATVYLAEDLKHRRKVAVKVLRPELTESIGGTRFLREIEIAAQLSHPHILPLHDSGEAAGFLYYVMPYVEGEPLRAKLSRERVLPPADAARYLREIADALAYAHAHGVVHRDIKPENVMLSGRHALVMDFGVAKAVSEAADQGLTTVGMTLGTPAYMAPEQAVADPNIDHRADLYALGVVGYEMLTGRTPFDGMTPQQALAAHVTRSPAPLAERAPGCPPALAALVMRCLEKRADDRPQHAGDLVPLLEGATTPSGGTAPAVMPISGATEAAIRRGHPGRVAGLFVVGAIIVLAVVRFLVLRLGLPDWVFWGAAALLAVGLPIMLATGLRERSRAIARTTAAHEGLSETGVTRWLTWRKALLGGALAFSGLASVAAAYTAMRLLGIGPVGTLVASGALERRDRLILADFENHTSDATLGASLTEAFRVDLSQSPTVRLVDASEVGDELRRMRRAPDSALSSVVAREVAERSGVKAVVTGQIDPVGRGYVLSATLASAGDGRVLAAVRETADDAVGLLKAIDRLSGKLRERIGESLVTIRANPPLERVTTSSLAALRKYTEGTRLIDLGRPEAAVPVLQEAIALDTGFAMAYRKLAVAIANASTSPAAGATSAEVDAATKAFAQRDRLPDVERGLATAYYYGVVEGDPGKEAATYRSLLAFDPDNDIALNNLALLMNTEGHYAEAESLATRALRVGSASQYFFQLLNAQVAQGRLEPARSTVARAQEALPPDAPIRLQFRVLLSLADGDRQSGEQIALQLRREQQSSLEWQARTSGTLAAITEAQGRLAEVARHRRDQMAESEARGVPADYIRAAAQLAALELGYRNQPAKALGILDEALGRHPLDSLEPMDRPYIDVAAIYAQAGKVEQAHRLLREYEAKVPVTTRRQADDAGRAYGRVAEAEGRMREAADAYREWNQRDGFCRTCGLFELASLYDRQGQQDSARVTYERILNTPTAVGHLAADRYALAPTYKRLGELSEAKGDRKAAADYYNRFVELWKNADAELQPGVKEVRGRLARLAQEPGT